MQHRTAPDDRLVLLGEEPHRDRANPVRVRWNQHVVDNHGSVLDTEHPRNRESPNVGIDEPDGLTALGERNGEVGRNRGLADAALARCDEHDSGTTVRVSERNISTFGVAVCGVVPCGRGRVAVQHLTNVCPLFIGHHGEVDRGIATEFTNGTRYSRRDLVLERATGNGQSDEHIDSLASDSDRLHHP